MRRMKAGEQRFAAGIAEVEVGSFPEEAAGVAGSRWARCLAAPSVFGGNSGRLQVRINVTPLGRRLCARQLLIAVLYSPAILR